MCVCIIVLIADLHGRIALRPDGRRPDSVPNQPAAASTECPLQRARHSARAFQRRRHPESHSRFRVRAAATWCGQWPAVALHRPDRRAVRGEHGDGVGRAATRSGAGQR